MLLRNRSRAVSSKQPLMADHQISSQSSSSPTQKENTKIPSFFGSPRFRAFKIKGHSDIDALISPTSILDTTKPFPFTHPFSYDKKQPATSKVGDNIGDASNSELFAKVPLGCKHSWDKSEPKGIGLALLDKLKDEELEQNTSCKPSNGKVLFGTKLRVHIPPFSATISPTESPNSQADFKLKTLESANSGIQTENPTSPEALVTEMELSEDYTCVISRGAYPRTTHIFDNCILESYSTSASANFLSFCYTCKKNLEQKNDIYIYRGEKAFCSRECRYREMLLDEIGNTEFDDSITHCS